MYPLHQEGHCKNNEMVGARLNNQMHEKPIVFSFAVPHLYRLPCNLNQLLRTVNPVHDYPFLIHLRLKFLQSLKVLFFKAPVTCNDSLFDFLQKSSSVMTNKCMVLGIPMLFINGSHFFLYELMFPGGREPSLFVSFVSLLSIL